MKPTSEMVKSEIKALRELKLEIPKSTDTGYEKINNWNLIHAQIQTLRYGLEIVDIMKQFPDDDHVQGAAEDARYWMGGSQIPSPSKTWHLAPKVEKNSG